MRRCAQSRGEVRCVAAQEVHLRRVVAVSNHAVVDNVENAQLIVLTRGALDTTSAVAVAIDEASEGQGRGISFEQDIKTDYLAALADAYTEFFYYYDEAPLLIVNAAEIDFANNHAHFEALLDQVFQMDSARQFFNPNPTLL